MNRLQKKCIIASGGLHLLLGVILIVGPGFLSSRSKPDNTPPLDFIAAATVDAAISGGGDNTVKSPPAALVAPPSPPTLPVPVTPPTPIVDKTPPPLNNTSKETKPPKVDPIPAEPKKPGHQIEVNTKPVIRNSAELKAASDAARAKAAKEAADAKRRTADAVSRAIAGIRGGVSGSTEIRLQGSGTTGVPYANFLSAVKKAYWDAWTVPDGVPDSTVKATVTIARDGTVVSARIIDQSGNAAVDNSVQMVLDRVKFAAPLPEDAKEDQRTVTINFNTEAKLTG